MAYTEIENGLQVGLGTLEEYVALVVDATVKSGIAAQVDAVRAGFNQVFQLSSLQIFSEEELEYLLCGRRELWLVSHVWFFYSSL
jgi:E3 ubiquitin-protein ligase TRIP12